MKQILSFLMIGFVLNAVFFASTAKANVVADVSAKKAETIEKLKDDLYKIGIGQDSKLEVKLTDGKKFSGYLKEINQEDFVVVAKNSDENRVRYDRVKKAKGKSHRHSFSMKTAYISAFLSVLLIFLNRGRTYDRYPNRYPSRY
jgi:hypothetical protein